MRHKAPAGREDGLGRATHQRSDGNEGVSRRGRVEQVHELPPPDSAAAGANFGCAVVSTPVNAPPPEAAASLLLVGAQYDGPDQAGTLYVYLVGKAPPSSPQAFNVSLVQTIVQPTSPGRPISRFFASALSIAPNGLWLAAGAASGNTSGAAFVYRRASLADSQWRLWCAAYGDAYGMGQNFGQAVAISNGGWLAVGLNNYNASQGAVVVYNVATSLEGMSQGHDNHIDNHFAPIDELRSGPVVIALASIPSGSFFGSSVVWLEHGGPRGQRGLTNGTSTAPPLLLATAPWQGEGVVYVVALSSSDGNAAYTVESVIEPPPPSASVASSSGTMIDDATLVESTASSGSGVPPTSANVTFGCAINWTPTTSSTEGQVDASFLHASVNGWQGQREEEYKGRIEGLLSVGAWGLHAGTLFVYNVTANRCDGNRRAVHDGPIGTRPTQRRGPRMHETQRRRDEVPFSISPDGSVERCHVAVTLTGRWQPFGGNGTTNWYFGSSVDRSRPNAATGRGILVVGAFAGFNDQGAAVVTDEH